MLFTLLCIILGVLVGAVGVMALSLAGHLLLCAMGVERAHFKAAKYAIIYFGVPGGIAGFVIGYQVGTTLVM